MYKFIVSFLVLLLIACSQKSEKNTGTIEAFAPAPDRTYERADMSPSAVSAAIPPQQSGLKAAYADDNVQFNAYLEFLDKYQKIDQITFPVQERIILHVVDQNDQGIPNATVTVSAEGHEQMQAQTYADGRTLFFPQGNTGDSYSVEISYKGISKTFTINQQGERLQTFKLPISRQAEEPVPVDILFVLDTTGSMGEEINRLKNTLLIIHDNLQALPVATDIRFGMVMFRDRGDEYVTQKINFTGDAASFQKQLSKVSAGGGGDRPEDLQTAIDVSVKKMGWRDEGVRLAYVITDADAHLDYGQKFTLLHSAQLAREKGVKLFSVGTGGLPVGGEISLRQIAQYTMGKYIFLTYGEAGESEGDVPGSVSHHTGENFISENLEAIIIRFAKEEIGHYVQRDIVEPGEEYFEAVTGEESQKVLADLFGQMVVQLVSYSGMKITSETTAAVLPLVAANKALDVHAEYFTEHLSQASVLYRGWTPVERKDLQKILDEHALNLSGLVEEGDLIEVGGLLGAQVLITGTLYEKDKNYEIYLKLMRAESGEVLSVTRAKIEKSLGL